MKTSANILKTVLGLGILCVFGSAGMRADGGGNGSCQSCAIDVSTLTSDSMSTTPQKWSVQYLVDRDVKPKSYCCDQGTPTMNSLEAEPDDNRGLALTPDGKH